MLIDTLYAQCTGAHNYILLELELPPDPLPPCAMGVATPGYDTAAIPFFVSRFEGRIG